MIEDHELADGIIKYASQNKLKAELAQCPTTPEYSQGGKLKRMLESKKLTPLAVSLKTNNRVSERKITSTISGGKELSSSDLHRVCQAIGVSLEFFNKPVERSINDMPEWESLGNLLMTFPYEQRVRIITSIRNSLGRFTKGVY